MISVEDKKRLEVIKQIRENMQEFVDSDGYVEDYPRYDEQALFIVDDGHLDWLIEQTEQKRKLERENSILKRGNMALELEKDGWFDKYTKNHQRVQELIEGINFNNKEYEKTMTENKHYRKKINVALALLESVPFSQPEASSAIMYLNEALECEK